jgi:hypothetical protein
MQVVRIAKANFYTPPAKTVWNVQSPLNSTYVTNYLTLRFSVETNLGLLYFYSLDGQERREINTTTVSKVPLPEYPPFIDGTLWNRRTEQGNVTLPYLSEGYHTLTIYQIYPLSPSHPEDGNVVSSALINFNITSNSPLTPSPEPQSEPFPTTLVLAPIATVAVIGVGLLVCFKKRKH